MKLSLLVVLFLCSNLSCCSCTITKEAENTVEKIIESERVIDKNTAGISYAHSPVDLFQLSHIEERLYIIIKEYVAKLENEPEYFFKRYIADYEASSIVAFNGWDMTMTDIKKHSLIHTNPLWSYRMLWRFVTDIPRIRDVLISSGDSGFVSGVSDESDTTIDQYFSWPTEEDLNRAMYSLLTLCDVYSLKISEFANGIIENVVTNASLSAIHCFEIAQFALKSNKQYTLAFEWVRMAKRKRLHVSADPILDYIEEAAISELFEDIIREHDAVWIAEGPSHSNLHRYFNKIDSGYILVPQRTVLAHEFQSKGDAGLHLSLNDITAFTTLCKGGNLQSEKEKLELYCWYESKMNPAWYINPQKMELHSKDPIIWQVYDFIGDDMINYLKREAVSVMERSYFSKLILDPETEQKRKEMNDYPQRPATSMSSYLDENNYAPKLPALSQRIAFITGLIPSWGIPNVEMVSSYILVSIYATGGHITTHLDSLASTEEFYEEHVEKNIGDTMASFILYLNNVTLGGNTAFTSVGVAVPPVKGSALFWYNRKYNGELDYRTYHGGCPALLGEKWVATKWIYNNLNILQRKCTLNKDE